MFLIGAFIIVASIVILKLSIKAPSIEEELKLLDILMESDIASNFRQELENSAKFSIKEKGSITTNVFDFANFSERKASEHALNFKFLFVGSLANVSNEYLNVSVINMLNKPINIDLNNGTASRNSELADNTRWDTNFSFSPGTTINLTVSYNSTYTENVTIKTKNNKDVYVGFFDTTLETSEAVYTNKTQGTYKLK